jgi:hypothetical protein
MLLLTVRKHNLGEFKQYLCHHMNIGNIFLLHDREDD